MVGSNKDKISEPQVNTGTQKQVIGAEGGGDDDLHVILKSNDK